MSAFALKSRNPSSPIFVPPTSLTFSEKEAFMDKLNDAIKRGPLGLMTRVLLTSAMCVGAFASASAGEPDAKNLLKGMSDYVASQQAISFNYDAGLEVVTKEDQKLALLSSGSVVLNRPDKVRFTRAGGFADIEGLFDGKTFTLLGKNANIYFQADAPGTFDQLVNALQEKFQRPLPGADLLLTNSYDELMSDVIDIKDLGSGVIGGVECDYLAFRKKEVDFQIWIAQGSKPYPCRLSITSHMVSGAPQYSIQLRDWKTGGDAEKANFTFNNTSNAAKIEVVEVREKFSDLPGNFSVGGGK
jgi:hypothetical protein